MNNDFNSWDKYCNYLWFDKQVNIWLDISKINFTLDQISSLENKFKKKNKILKIGGGLKDHKISDFCYENSIGNFEFFKRNFLAL